MLVHAEMSKALAEARYDDLRRELRPRTGARRPSRRVDTESAARDAGTARRIGEALRRVYRTRAAEPVA